MNELYINREGYSNPTEGEALSNILREERRARRMALRAELLMEHELANDTVDAESQLSCCVAYIKPSARTRGSGSCKATNNTYCPGFNHCPFYQSEADAVQSLQKANARLRSLPYEKQVGIANKYHVGIMPWRINDAQ